MEHKVKMKIIVEIEVTLEPYEDRWEVTEMGELELFVGELIRHPEEYGYVEYE